MFAGIPVRSPLVKTKKMEKRVQLKLHRDDSKKSWLQMLLPALPPIKTFELDAVGRFVWDLCDGKRTVADIADLLAREKKLEIKEAEVSLATYLKTLTKKGIIAIKRPEQEEEI